MRKIAFGDLKMGARFFVIDDGLEYRKCDWTAGKAVRSGRIVQFVKSGMVYVKA